MNALQSSPPPIAYSPQAACAILGIGLTKLYLEIARGRIEARKAGNRTLIPAVSLLDYLSALPLADIRSGQNAVANK
jgi:excisionase family DNA binding protein